MKTKQIIVLIIALALFTVTGLSNVKKSEKPSFLESLMATSDEGYPDEDYVAILRVSGTISESSDSGSIYSEPAAYQHADLLNYVDDLMFDDNNKALYLIVDSPGGTLYASDELYLKLLDYKETTGRKIYCYFESMACSGGYYIAMAADEIYANRNCTTGSIGVYSQLLDLSGLYEKLGIKPEYIASSENKTMGSGDQPLTDEQRAILQSQIDEAYNQFVSVVVSGRGMSEDRIRYLADGRTYTANQALGHGLIDGILTEEEYDDHVAEETDVYQFYEPDFTSFNWSFLSGMINTAMDSEAKTLAQLIKDCESKGGRLYVAPLQ